MSLTTTFWGCIRFSQDSFVCYIVVCATDEIHRINFIPAGSPILKDLHGLPLQKSLWGQPLLDLLNGSNITIPHSFPDKTPFLNSVYQHLYSIPYGKTVTYGKLATMAGYPKAARAVGLAMKNNPLPIIYPCHRVIGSDGKMHGFCGNGKEYIQIKKALLYIEKLRSISDNSSPTICFS